MAVVCFMPSETLVTLGNGNAEKCLILLHGLTLSGNQFAPVGKFLLSQLGNDWQIILPTAPMQKVTWLDGQTTTAWFDLPYGRFDDNQDEVGITQANAYIHSLIDGLILGGVNPKKIVIGGFSQGGALALLSALTYPKRLGGAACLSGYLPIADKLSECLQQDKNLPLLLAHGTEDVPIRIDLAEISAKWLKKQGFDVRFRAYPIGHTLDEQELFDVVDWLRHL